MVILLPLSKPYFTSSKEVKYGLHNFVDCLVCLGIVFGATKTELQHQLTSRSRFGGEALGSHLPDWFVVSPIRGLQLCFHHASVPTQMQVEMLAWRRLSRTHQRTEERGIDFHFPNILQRETDTVVLGLKPSARVAGRSRKLLPPPSTTVTRGSSYSHFHRVSDPDAELIACIMFYLYYC